MNVLFVGGVFPSDQERRIINDSRNGTVDNAANSLQWKIIRGIEKNIEKPLKILSAEFVGTFPSKYHKLFIHSYQWSHVVGSYDYSISFINLPAIRNISRESRLKREAKKWARSTFQNKEESVIIAYSLHSPIMAAVKAAKKININIKTCLIVPDLPEYMNMSLKVSILYKLLKKMDRVKIDKYIKAFDCFVLLTKYMRERLDIQEKRSIVIEGIADHNHPVPTPNYSDEKTIVYTGSINKKYGITDLVDSFKYIKNENYKLIICGGGDAADYVKQRAFEDNRITYLGVLPIQKALEYQLSATALINPRPNNEIYTKFSFPSKIMEYLSTGVPVIAYKLDGVPDEYDNYMLYVKGEGPRAIAEKIIEVCEKYSNESLLELGQKSRRFILEQKNEILQTKKILSMIREL